MKNEGTTWKKGSKTPPKRVRTLFGGVFAGFLALDASKKVFEHFLINILCCLNILNKISKISTMKLEKWRHHMEKRVQNPSKKGPDPFWRGFCRFFGSRSFNKSFWAFSYRYSVLSQYSEKHIKNWKKPYCPFKIYFCKKYGNLN